MKTHLKLLVSIIGCLCCLHTYAQTLDHVPGQVIVKMKQGRSLAQKNALKTGMKASTQKTFSSLNIELWQIDESQQKADIKQLIRDYTNHPDIEYIEPNYIFHLATDMSPAGGGEGGGQLKSCENQPTDIRPVSQKRWVSTHRAPTEAAPLTTTPNDPLFNDQWNLNNTGQYGGTPDADINAPEAWDITTGSPDIQIAILDTGVDWTHPDLIDNIWQNLDEDDDEDGHVIEYDTVQQRWVLDPGDINGTDNDDNGYADDLIGWDFRDGDNDPMYDASGSLRWHGTHIAGIAGASGNNGTGISGVTWNVQMPILKIFRGNGSTSQSRIIAAIEYATQMNFPILNNSWGGESFTPPMAMRDAMQTAADNGQLIIAAAGNGGINNDVGSAYYPASLNMDNIISVASIDRDDELALTSNFGATRVDIAAPGVDILSCFPMNDYDSRSGTSQATPHVAAACALLWQENPTATPAEIKAAIINSATVTPALTGNCVSDGRLNLSEALTYEEDTTTTTVVLSCRERDSLALVALYNAMDGANWYNIWDLGQPIGEWYGVTLNEDGCVTVLSLNNNQLNGSIPSAIGNLSSLTHVSLNNNQLIDNIPSEIGNLINLTVLALNNNQLNGSIPLEVGNLSNLIELSLSNNQLSGSIPPEIGSLINLTQLWLHYNQLTDSIPSQIGNLSNLSSLSLYDNQLNANIPSEIGNLGSLTHLSLYNNQLSGNIPLEIGNLTNLTFLSLSNNQLTGNIPSEIGNFSNLTYLYLYNNQLSGNIPLEIGNFSNLIYLLLSANQLIGDIPTEIGNLGNLRYLSLSSNQLSGNIPSEIGNLSNLIELSLSSNQLSGSIPVELGNLSNLNQLYLYNNQLSGCYDENLINLCAGANGSVSNGNNFDAPWEGFCNAGAGACSIYGACRESDSLALITLYDAANGANWTNTWNLNQPMNTWYGIQLNENGCVSCIDMDGDFDCVVDINYAGNNLSGNLPTEISNLSNLIFLDLSYNGLIGNIPVEAGSLGNLTYLNLSGNQLSGSIPTELGNLSNLTGLYLYGNQLSGSIPTEIGNLSNLTGLNLYGNQLSGSIPVEIGNRLVT